MNKGKWNKEKGENKEEKGKKEKEKGTVYALPDTAKSALLGFAES